MVEYKAVLSSNLLGVAYDEDTHELSVQFKGGSTYKYKDVPPEEYGALMDAPSPGGYFNDFIKNSYKYSRG